MTPGEPPFPSAVWLDTWALFQPVDPATSAGGRWVRWCLGRLHPRARHCWTMIHVGQSRRWFSLDAQATGGIIEAEDVEADDPIGFYVDQRGCTAVRIAHWTDSRRAWLLRAPLTCTMAVKFWGGIRAWWVITPHQLLRYLERRGFETRRPAADGSQEASQADAR